MKSRSSRLVAAQAREAFLQEGAAGLASFVTPRVSSMQQGLAFACPMR